MNGSVSASIAAIASDRPSRSPMPSRCRNRSSARRACAISTRSRKARVVRVNASARGSGSRVRLDAGAPLWLPAHKRSRKAGSASDPAAEHTAGKAGGGRPRTGKLSSAKRWSRPTPTCATRSKNGSSSTMAATTPSVSSSAGKLRASHPRRRLVARTVFDVITMGTAALYCGTVTQRRSAARSRSGRPCTTRTRSPTLNGGIASRLRVCTSPLSRRITTS